MIQTFNYKKKITAKSFLLPAAGIAMIGITFFRQIDIAFKNFVILPYPYSNYFFWGLGSLMIISFIAALSQSTKKREVKLNTESLDFTVGSFTSKDISIKYGKIKSLKLTEDEDDGTILEIFAYGSYNEIFAQNFDSQKEFDAFYKSLSNKLEEC